MSFWSKIKAAAIPGNTLTPQVQPQLPLQQPAVNQQVTPPPVPAPLINQPTDDEEFEFDDEVVDPSQVGQGNAIITKRKLRGKAKMNEIQAPLDPIFTEIQKQFQQTPIYQQLESNDPRFSIALANFFQVPDGGGSKKWYNLLINHVSDFPAAAKYTNAVAVREWLRNPQATQEVGETLKAIVQKYPPEFAEAVQSTMGWRPSDQAQHGLSMNTKTKGKGGMEGELGDGIGGGVANRVQQRDEYDDSGAEDASFEKVNDEVAKFWSIGEKNKIIAPTPVENEQVACMKVMSRMRENSEHVMSSIQDDLLNLRSESDDPNEKSAPIYNNLQDANKVVEQSTLWPLFGLSDGAKFGDTAMTNWQEYLVEYKGMQPDRLQDALKQGLGPRLIENIAEDAEDPESPFMQFFSDKAKGYMQIAYDMQQTDNMLQVEDRFRPKPGDFESFKRMAKVAAACAMREYRYNKINQKGEKIDSSGTSLRRWAYLKTKTPAIVDKLQKALSAPAGVYTPFGEPGVSGNQKYLHRGVHLKDGQPVLGNDGKPELTFQIRNVNFNKNVPIRSDEDLRKYIEDDKNSQDTELTSYNWGEVAKLIDVSSYVPKMLDLIQEVDPTGLSKSPKTELLANRSPLSKELDGANEQYLQQNPQSKDRLSGYRKMLGTKLQEQLNARGVSSEQISKYILDNAIRKGSNISNYQTSQKFMQDILSGTPTRYSSSDFETMADVINTISNGHDPISVADIYSPYTFEYDRHNTNDCSTDLAAGAATSVATYGRYFIHRKRVQALRGFDKTNWSNKSLYYFLSMSNVHRNLATYDGNERATTKSDDKAGPTGEAAGIGIGLQEEMGHEHHIHNELYDPETGKDSKIINEEMSQEHRNRMKKVKPSDFYNYPSQSALLPTGPNQEMVYRDENGDIKRQKPTWDENFKRTQPGVKNREVKPTFLLDRAMDSFKNANPEFAELGAPEIMQKMKNEKIQELGKIVSLAPGYQELEQIIQSGDEETILNEAMSHMRDNDKYLHDAIKKIIKNDDPNAQKKNDDLATKRWNQLINNSGKDELGFATEYLSDAANSVKQSVERASSRIKEIQNLTPRMKAKLAPRNSSEEDKITFNQREQKRLKEELQLFVPMKYLRKMHLEDSRYQPMDFVKYDNLTQVAKIIELTIKTAMSIDRLSTIKKTLERFAMPAEFVDGMMNTIADEYDQQSVVLSRSPNVGGSGSPADKKRRRLWSLF